MRRRRLILTALGALAGCLGLPKIALAAADRNLTVANNPLIRSGSPSRIVDGKLVGPLPFNELFVPVTGTVDEAIGALVSEPEVPKAELFVSVSTDVSAAISGLQPSQLWVVHIPSSAKPAVPIGPLFISDEYEMQAFLKSMADEIYKAKERS